MAAATCQMMSPLGGLAMPTTKVPPAPAAAHLCRAVDRGHGGHWIKKKTGQGEWQVLD